MKFFCPHRRWKTVSKCYTPGTDENAVENFKTHSTEDSRLMLDHLQRRQFGVTTVEQVCEDCGTSKSYTVTGKIEGATVNTSLISE